MHLLKILGNFGVTLSEYDDSGRLRIPTMLAWTLDMDVDAEYFYTL